MQEVQMIFERQAHRLCLIDALAGRQFTYGEFYQRALQTANMLYTQGIRRQDRVALVLTNSAEFAALYFGCLFLGSVAVPINPSLHPNEIAFILAHAGVKLVIYSPATKKLVGESLPALCLLPLQEQIQKTDDLNSWSFDSRSASDIPGWQPLAEVHGDDLFSITFTSGTTSLPKGVAHRISGLLENAKVFNQQLGFDPDNRLLHVLPMAYMAGFLNTLLCPFMAGSSIVLARPFDAQTALNFWQPVIQHQADTFWLAPTMLAALLRVDRNTDGQEYCREHVKTICVGTAPLPLKLKWDFERKYSVELFESYGLSELLLVSTNSNTFPRLDGSVGRVLPGVKVQVVNEQGEVVRPGEDGEIWIKTPYLMAGYLDYQTLHPNPVHLEDWFPTGDIGQVNEGGYLFITGRKKDLIIRGGLNISPRAVEEVLLQHEAIDQVAVLGLPHAFYGEEVVAAVKLKQGYTLALERTSLDLFCKTHLNLASVPTRYVELDQFPVSANGKIQKNKLREQFLNMSTQKQERSSSGP